jgi:HlyD family secretion protein
MKIVTSLVFIAALGMIGCGNNNKNLITATGTIEATEVTVSAQASGPVKLLRVDEGNRVNAGDTLLVLDNTDWVYQLQQAQAGLDGTEAQLRMAREGMREEDVLQAEANFKSAENDLKRMEELAKSRSISDKQLEDTRTRYTLMQQTWIKMKRGSRIEEIQIAKARRDQSLAQVSSLNKKVNDCVVTAPLAGTVTKRFVEKGELVGQGMPLVRIANLARMNIMIYVPEVELPRIALGQQAAIRVDAFADRDFQGTVTFISPTAEFTPKNIQTKDDRTKLVFGVRLAVDNPDGTLKAGIPADVTLPTGQ